MEERSDAVRVMTIHKAKGLDFPIVFVAGCGLRKRTHTGSFLADAHRKRIFALNLGSRGSGLQTPSWKEMTEEAKKRDNAELIRLLYVGLTRARDHLILCTHTRGWKQIEGTERWIPDMDGTRLKPLTPFLTQCISSEGRQVRWLKESPETAVNGHQAEISPSPGDWETILKKEYQELHTLLMNTPASRDIRTASESSDGFESEGYSKEDREPESARERAVRLGVAFHETMEKTDFFNLNGLAGNAEEIAAKHKLDEASRRLLEEMVRKCLSSALFERVRRASGSGGRMWRELPFVRPVTRTAVEEGKIDLLFEESDGWVLVDYKTDRTPEKQDPENVDEFFREKYADQMREYEYAMKDLTVRVKAAYLLLARTGRAVEIPR
jgi:ATP-dependent helicase/nuclease subunit A